MRQIRGLRRRGSRVRPAAFAESALLGYDGSEWPPGRQIHRPPMLASLAPGMRAHWRGGSMAWTEAEQAVADHLAAEPRSCCRPGPPSPGGWVASVRPGGGAGADLATVWFRRTRVFRARPDALRRLRHPRWQAEILGSADLAAAWGHLGSRADRGRRGSGAMPEQAMG